MKTKIKKIALETLILEVLSQELTAEHMFLTESQIAYRCNGLSYAKNLPRKAPIVGKSVRDRMPKVREIADEKGMTIVADRIKSHSDEKTGLKILGWRIAGEDDAKYILNELEIRRTLGNGNIRNSDKIETTALRKGLIAKQGVPQLEG
jgi:hypothetical protein